MPLMEMGNALTLKVMSPCPRPIIVIAFQESLWSAFATSSTAGSSLIVAWMRSEALMNKVSLGQRVFVDRAVLHNDQKIFAGVFDDFDIFQRIAINQQQICECALFHDTKPARVRINKSGKRHQFPIVCSGHLKHLGRRVPAGQLSKLSSMASASNMRTEQDICTESNLDLVLPGQPVSVVGSCKHFQRTLPRRRIHRRHIFIIEEWL